MMRLTVIVAIFYYLSTTAMYASGDDDEPQYVPEPVAKVVHIVKPKLPAKKKLTGHSSNVKYAHYYAGNLCLEPNPFVPLTSEPYFNRTSKEMLKVYYRCIGGLMGFVVCGYKKKPVSDLCVLFDKKCWQVMLETPNELEAILERRKRLEKCLGRVFIG